MHDLQYLLVSCREWQVRYIDVNLYTLNIHDRSAQSIDEGDKKLVFSVESVQSGQTWLIELIVWDVYIFTDWYNHCLLADPYHPFQHFSSRPEIVKWILGGVGGDQVRIFLRGKPII